jgi:hypothetical protein
MHRNLLDVLNFTMSALHHRPLFHKNSLQI